jgi:hypothetical protein
MDINLTFIDLGIVILIFLPILFLLLKGNGTKRNLHARLKALADQNGLSIAEKEFWADTYMGLDRAKKKLLFLRSQKDGLQEVLVDLDQVSSCKITASHQKGQKNKKEDILNYVGLTFKPVDKGTDVQILDFYDRERTYIEDHEVQRAERWMKLVTQQLSA